LRPSNTKDDFIQAWGGLSGIPRAFSFAKGVTVIQFWEYDQLTPEQHTKIMRRAETDIRDLLPLAQ
jgi:hypothetical protein